MKEQGFFDPKLELSKYRFPIKDLLKDYGESSITIDQEELELNKNKIIDTLKNYNIGIAKIKATIGPTVTLYEIIPDARNQDLQNQKFRRRYCTLALCFGDLG